MILLTVLGAGISFVPEDHTGMETRIFCVKSCSSSFPRTAVISVQKQQRQHLFLISKLSSWWNKLWNHRILDQRSPDATSLGKSVMWVRWILETSNAGDTTTSLGRLFLCIIVLVVKKFPLVSILILHRSNLCPLPLISSMSLLVLKESSPS